jgi:hypothetical protein
VSRLAGYRAIWWREGAGTRLRRPMVTGSREGRGRVGDRETREMAGPGFRSKLSFARSKAGGGFRSAQVRNRGAEKESGAFLLVKTVPSEVPNTSFPVPICQASLGHRGKALKSIFI